MSDFLEVDDLSPSALSRVLERAQAWKASPGRVDRVLDGEGVALLFEKPSARTRSSTEMAVVSLGGHPIYIRRDEVGFDVRESVEDIARTLACYCSVLTARVFDHRTLYRVADAVEVPVVNLLSDRGHPCQAVADMLTLRERFGTLDGRRLVFVGDGNNVAASLAFAAALTGLELVVASPPGYELDDEIVDRARNAGGAVDVVNDPFDAVKNADAVYTDVWTSMGDEDQADIRREAFAAYQVNEDLMAASGNDPLFMHCLPAHRGEEVTAAVLESAASVVWEQAANRMHAARALLPELLER
jgi:ornithine carbamoyltransferase